MGGDSTIEAAFRSGERRIWGLCYRMTGVAADADELVQETFVKALESGRDLPGPDLERWLVRVATNLSLDRLRRRRRRRYIGPWLPSPVETAELGAGSDQAGAGYDGVSLTSDTAAGAAERLERLEQVSYAFLVALEALGPRARAALLLTDVLDYPAAEVARVLDTSEGNVRVLRHRARRALEGVDSALVASPDVRQRQQSALQKLLLCMVQQDAAGMKALLAEDVRSITDGGGRYTALREPLAGRQAVVRFHLETARRRAPISHTEFRWINGAAALVVVTRPLRPQMAPRLVMRCEVDAEGRFREILTILNPPKLTAGRFDEPVADPREIALPPE
ncbi:MAG: sigma-70 family RNA polymerase sigma factor [Candidatus Binatia bacterium]